MAEPAGFRAAVKKRWRGWLRAIHRDFGYLAVGFTFIYALSGIAINHISDWDPNFRASEKTLHIAPIPAELPDAEAIQRVTDATGTGTPDDVFRAGDEIRLSYHSGTQVTVIGDTGDVTVQARSDRFFFRVANWLHYNRGKKAWTYVADVYAFMLLYLAISGLFMIKGKLGLRWRGTILVTLGIAIPVTYVALSGGPSKASSTKTATAATKPATAEDTRPVEDTQPIEAPPAPPSDDEFARPPVRRQPPPGP
ncbi:MAG: PepSY-associated TM helix domain-containing protein [Kofleriaceae bacterium]|nr:PepSY-associated TM helix domain-containing protein [Kofleriaceae bacterium]